MQIEIVKKPREKKSTRTIRAHTARDETENTRMSHTILGCVCLFFAAAAPLLAQLVVLLLLFFFYFVYIESDSHAFFVPSHILSVRWYVHPRSCIHSTQQSTAKNSLRYKRYIIFESHLLYYDKIKRVENRDINTCICRIDVRASERRSVQATTLSKFNTEKTMKLMFGW